MAETEATSVGLVGRPRYDRWTHPIGLGIMGMPMARGVLKAGHRVIAQSLSKYKRL